MQWKKTSEELVRFLDEKMTGIKAERRKMFGYPCYFINNNMCIGTFEEGLFLRLGTEGRENAMAEHKQLTFFEPRPGRKMGEYVVVPRNIRDDSAEFDRLLELSIRYVSSLPPKQKKKGKGK
jgi:TfoX/Sxy family transcriptional regulator of competence genes